MNVLVTGGAGYIGSHTVVELIKAKHFPIILDNFSNSNEEVLNRIHKITGVKPKLYKEDTCNKKAVDKIFKENKIDAVIHFAGLKAVGESVQKPLEYYQNNLISAMTIMESMQAAGCYNFVFSSSATVYGIPKQMPIKEDAPIYATNPYGQTKVMIEQMIKDICVANSKFNATILRYFNPIGAHKSGIIGEDPNGIPNNLVPYITQVAIGKLPYLRIYGKDYKTHDGTGVRDYIHVCDLANGHVLALKKINGSGLKIYNLGTGNGYSVLDVVKAFEKATKKEIPKQFVGRRPGDVAENFACPDKAAKEIGFKCRYNLERMAKDSWNWQKNNPDGYRDKKKK